MKNGISVIIPTYQSPDALDLCLRSCIEGQTIYESKEPIQIIVFVDGFYDINKEVLKKYKKDINILISEENVGLCRGTNLSVYNAIYDKILIVNDDNVFPQGWDFALISDFKNLNKEWRSGVVLTPNQIEPYPSIFPQFIITDLGRDPKSFDLKQFWSYEYHQASGDKIEANGSTLPIFMYKQDYLRVGGWDENYPTNGVVCDWDFFLKCQLSGLKMVRTWNSHFYHFVSLSTNVTEEQQNQRRQKEQEGHEYAFYKWGSYIKHNSLDNSKYL